MAETELVEDSPIKETKPKRGRPRKTDAAAEPAKAEAKPEKVVKKRGKNSWPSLMKKVEEELIVDYDMNGDFEEKAAIRHKKFGIGVITKILDDNKIEVVFEEDKKVLAQNWE